MRPHAHHRPAFHLQPLARAVATAWLLASAASLQAAGPAPGALPTGPRVVAGQASVATQGGQMTVHNTPGAVLDWQSFSIGAAAGVHFQQAGASSKVLNRVTGTDPSQLFGTLTSNGQVWLTNPHGVLFGASARIDVAGLVASTLRLNESDFLAQRYRFNLDETLPGATVRNEGSLHSHWGGQVVLLGERVENLGEVATPGGSLQLAAGRSVELVDTGLPNLAVRVQAPAGEVLNLGRLVADGGAVDVFGAIVNQQGLVQADTLRPDAQGRIVLRASDTLMLGDGSVTRAGSSSAGLAGGQVDLLGAQVGLVGTATVDASGSAGGGSIRLGGGLMGRDTSVPNALAVYIGPDAHVRADATGDAGPGGRITVWSDTATRAYGRFSAHGGALQGDGGFVETSGGWLDARPAGIDVTSRGGVAGLWLIDPNNLTISDTGPDSNITGTANFTTTGDGAVITTGTIAAALNAGNSVTLTTATGGTEAGDILMVGANLNVAPPTGVGLTLAATRDILVRDSAITSTGAPLSLDLVSAGGGVGAIEILRSTIDTAGGNVRLGGATALAMPLPDGTSTSTLYAAAIGYDAATAVPPTALSAPRHGVLVQESTIDAGTGSFSAIGLAAPTSTSIALGARLIGSLGTPNRISAAEIDVTGFGLSTLGYGLGVVFNTELVATERLALTGAGPNRGVTIDSSRLSLLAAPGVGGELRIDGFGGGGESPSTVGHFGVLIQAVNDIPGWGIRVENGDFTVLGRSIGDAPGGTTPNNGQGVRWLATAGTQPGVFDLRSATSVLVEGDSLNASGVWLGFGSLQLPTAVAAQTQIRSLAGALRVESLDLSGAGSLSLAASGGAEPGDVLVLDSDWSFAPGASAIVQAQAARDVVVHNSSITSTAAPLLVVLQSAGAGAGVIEVYNSSITTQGGDVALQGAITQQLPLPNGLFTSASYQPAIAHGNGGFSLSGGLDGINVEASVLDLGSGRFTATGLTNFDNRDGLRIGSGSFAPTFISASHIDLVGVGFVTAPSNIDVGVMVQGDNTNLTATQSFTIDGAGSQGISIEAGARLALNAVSGSGAVFAVRGVGQGSHGVAIYADEPDAGFAGRGTRITVSNARLDITGNSYGDAGFVILNDAGAPGPVLDLAGATAFNVLVEQSVFANGFSNAAYWLDVDVVLPTGGATTLTGDLAFYARNTFITGDGGSLSVATQGVGLEDVLIASTGAPLTLTLGTTGVAPLGVFLVDTIVTTNGGDVRFGLNQTVTSAVLGSTTAAAPWVEFVDQGGFAGTALSITDTVIDAGTGRISGGGASRSATGSTGTLITGSNLTARDITLAGRSDLLTALVVEGSQLLATERLTLDALAASTGPALEVRPSSTAGSLLQLDDPAIGVASQMLLTGRQLGAGIGVVLSGDDVGSARETRIVVNGAPLFVEGSSSGGGIGLAVTGTAAAPGGLLINALGATAVSLEGSVLSGVGAGVLMEYTNVIGPQGAAGATMLLVGNGVQTGGAPGTRIVSSSINASGDVTLRGADGLAVEDSLVTAEAGLLLETSGSAPGPIFIRNSRLATAAAGAALVLRGAANLPAIGHPLLASGSGVSIADSALLSPGAGASLRIEGQGAAAGGNGVSFTRTPMMAENITLRGTGVGVGNGVFGEDLTQGVPSVLTATNLSVAGTVSSPIDNLAVGVRLGANVQLAFTGRGTALIEGDYVLLGDTASTNTPTFLASGDAASFSVQTTRSLALRFATLDFSAGAGTSVALQADAAGAADGDWGGRPRLQNSTVRTGGGDFSIGGTGVRNQDPDGTPRVLNFSVGEANGGLIVTGTGNVVDAGTGDISFLAVSSPLGVTGLLFTGDISLTGGAVTLSGRSAGPSGYGMLLGQSGFPVAINIAADSIVLNGEGTGIDSVTGLPSAGVYAEGASTWTARNGGPITITTTGGPVALTGTTLNAGNLAIDAATGVTLTNVQVQTLNGALLQTNRVGEGGVALRGSAITASGSNASIRIERADGNEVLGSAATDSGQGVTLTDSLLSAGQPGSLIEVRGQGAGTGGTGVVFTRTNIAAPTVTIMGKGGAALGDGVFSEDLSGGPSSLVSARDLTIGGIAVDPGTLQDPNNPDSPRNTTKVGVRLGGHVALALSDRGAALISGNTVLLGGDSTVSPFIASGDPASFTVVSDGTQRVSRATLDFSSGAGTAVGLLADTDGNQAGRSRLESSTVRTGGGNFTMSGAGEASFGAGAVANFNLRIGASGVLLTGGASVDAGGGDIAITGAAPFDPANQDNTSLGGGWGFNVAGTATLTAASVAITGTGGTKGIGIEIGTATAPSVLNIVTNSLTLDGNGAGTLADGSDNIGITTVGASNWVVNNGGDLTVRGADAVSLTGLTAVAAGQVLIDGRGGLGRPGVSLVDSNITGAGIAIEGIGGGNLPGLSFTSSSAHALTATSGDLRLTGRDPSRVAPGIQSSGAWTWATPGRLQIEADNALVLGDIGAGPTVVFSGTNQVDIALDTAAPATMGVRGSLDFQLDSADLSEAMAGLGATSALRVRSLGVSDLSISGALSVPGTLEIQADRLALLPGAALAAGGAGDAIVLRGSSAVPLQSFSNTADPAPLSAPNGRWVLLAQDPRQTVLGNLAPAFSAYDLAGQPWAQDAQGNFITPASGNAVGFALAPADVAGVTLGGLLVKVYDASTAVTLDALTWTITGLVPGDVLTLAGVDIATLADKNAGTGKPVTLDAGSVFTVLGADGQPVFGYATPVFTANVTPAVLAVGGTTAASRVYDGGVVASLAGLGSVSPLGADSVALAGGSASFADRNVGTAKPVAVSGLTLTGPDAGNYTLLQPVGVVADITPRPLPVVGLSAQNKVYDSTPAAVLSGGAGIVPLGSDDVQLAGAASAAFADKNAGVAKPVAVGGLSLAGTDAGNYSLQLPTGLVADITPAPLALTGLTAAGRVYDGRTSVALGGSASVAPLPGDDVALAGTAAGTLPDKGVGLARPVALGGLSLAGVDAGNYTLVLPSLVADITPATLTLAGVAAADKVYDGLDNATVSATLGGAVPGDALTLGLTGRFADANAGSAKPVAYSASLGGADAVNYLLDGSASGSLLANISPALLTYLATPVAGTVGQLLPALTGTVTGFVAGDTLASATSGTLAWTTLATAESLPGRYAVEGAGLSAPNYTFTQAPGNAEALVLRNPPASDPATVATSVVVSSALAAVQLPVLMSTPTQGRVLDVTLAMDALSGDGGSGGGTAFEALDWSRLPRDEVQTLLAARARLKQALFQNGVYRLQQDPSLADVANCRTEAEVDTGQCLITEQLKQQIQAARAAAAAERARVAAAQAQAQAQADARAAAAAAPAARPLREGQRRVRQAVLPNIERKLALLIGINRYQDRRIPQLKGALPDAKAVNQLLEERLGYETTVLENPSREAMVRALNRLALQADANDSVIVYYAGHGVVEPVNGVETGFWLPSDGDVDKPGTWLANADIARLVGAVSARQIMLVSDSCYAGTLVGRDRVQVGAGAKAEDLLQRRAAVVMASGGDEPVSDRGKNGHSAFAWHFMQALQDVDQWQVGSSLFDRVRAAVVKELPQTPQYGASSTAGHQGNTDYLFERREIEKLTR